MTTDIIIENEKNYPDLVRLRKVVNDKDETEERRFRAAFLYALIAFSLYNEKEG